ncbi:MAG: alkaline phytoceramidase [Sedimenticolaceae bacterium]
MQGKTLTDLSLRQRNAILIGLLVLVVIGVGILEPIPQDPGYHLFADSRKCFGIPNFNDVVSNIGFTLVGLLGLFLVIGEGRRSLFAESVDARPYSIFFIAVALVGIGSAYYHWAPSNERLFWDRLPIAIAFMAITSATVADRIDAKAGNGWLLLLLLAGGAASLIYWHWTESLGRGDLRLYAIVQFYPMLALPVVIALFPRHRYTVGRYLAWVIVWYAVSKVLEHFDREIFELLGHAVSGHTLKHLAAALATLVVLKMLSSRRHSGHFPC